VKAVESRVCSHALEHVGETCFRLFPSDVGCTWTFGGFLFGLVYVVRIIAFVF